MADPVIHFEIISADAPNLQRFYGSVFGWKIAVDNPFGYGMVDTRTPGRGINGGIGMPPQGGTGHFTLYVQVSNIDAALSRVVTEGGRIAMPKHTVPNGPTLAHFFDPAGHLMGLIEGVSQSNGGGARPTASAPARSALPPAPARSGAIAARPTQRPAAKPVAKVKPKAASKPAKKKSKPGAKPKGKTAKRPATKKKTRR